MQEHWKGKIETETQRDRKTDRERGRERDRKGQREQSKANQNKAEMTSHPEVAAQSCKSKCRGEEERE